MTFYSYIAVEVVPLKDRIDDFLNLAFYVSVDRNIIAEFEIGT